VIASSFIIIVGSLFIPLPASKSPVDQLHLFNQLLIRSRHFFSDSIVSEYSRNPARFKSDFGSAMIKMGDIGLLTGSAGQIRRVCSAVNICQDLLSQSLWEGLRHW